MYDVLSHKGFLVVILNSDSGDWWDIYNGYKKKYQKYVVKYIPLSDFKNTLNALGGTVRAEKYKSTLKFDSFDALVGCIAKLVLGISDEDVFENNLSEFREIASGIVRKNGGNLMVFESEFITIEKD